MDINNAFKIAEISLGGLNHCLCSLLTRNYLLLGCKEFLKIIDLTSMKEIASLQ